MLGYYNPRSRGSSDRELEPLKCGAKDKPLPFINILEVYSPALGIGMPGPQAFRLSVDYTMGFSHSTAGIWHVAGLLGFDSHMNRFL